MSRRPCRWDRRDRFPPLAHAPVNFEHELWKCARRFRRSRFDEQVHQHRLAAPDAAPHVDPLGPRLLRLEQLRQQPPGCPPRAPSAVGRAAGRHGAGRDRPAVRPPRRAARGRAFRSRGGARLDLLHDARKVGDRVVFWTTVPRTNLLPSRGQFHRPRRAACHGRRPRIGSTARPSPTGRHCRCRCCAWW